MTALIVALALSASPDSRLDSRLLIIGGGKTKDAAEKALASLKKVSLPKPAPDFPKIIKSDGITGLKPGFWLTVFGACPLDDLHGALQLRIVHASTAGSYFRDVVWPEGTASCPPRGADAPRVLFTSPAGQIAALTIARAAQPTTPDGGVSKAVLLTFDGLEAELGGKVEDCTGSPPEKLADGARFKWDCITGPGCSEPTRQDFTQTVRFIDGGVDVRWELGEEHPGLCH